MNDLEPGACDVPACTMYGVVVMSGKYCWKCGNVLGAPQTCECGEAILLNYNYCTHCGKKVS